MWLLELKYINSFYLPQKEKNKWLLKHLEHSLSLTWTEHQESCPAAVFEAAHLVVSSVLLSLHRKVLCCMINSVRNTEWLWMVAPCDETKQRLKWLLSSPVFGIIKESSISQNENVPVLILGVKTLGRIINHTRLAIYFGNSGLF